MTDSAPSDPTDPAAADLARPGPANGPGLDPDSGRRPDTDPWLRLDSRMLSVAATRALLSIVPIAAALTIFGAGLDPGLRTALVAALLIGFGGAVGETFRWITWRYRVTEDRVELRSGLLTREARWVPRDRIRTVDLKAGPLQRIFGLCVARIGTGRQGGRASGLRLDAVGRAEGERLRAELLDRHDPGLDPGHDPGRDSGLGSRRDSGLGTDRDSSDAEPPDAEAAVVPIAGFRLARLPYSLLSWWTLGLPAVVLGGVFQLLSTAGVRPDERQLISVATDVFGPVPPVAAVVAVVAILVVLGALGAAAFSFETWWRYRLVRRPSAGIVALRHGLITLRSKDLEERRMRGAELVETIPLRPVGGVEIRAVMTGLTSTESPWGARAEALGPNMSWGEGARIVSDLLGEAAEEDPTATDRLNRHPHAALSRRRIRGTAAALALGAGLAATGQATATVATGPAAFALWAAVAAVALLPAALWAAADAYRGLGNGLTPRFLITRHGLLHRRTTVLERDGIVGWNLRASLFQRRRGLATLTATTAAGRSAYSAPDMAATDAVDLADRAVPGLLTAFLSREK